MSLSQPEWQAKFLKEGETLIRWSDQERKDQKAPNDWKQNWNHWANGAAYLKADRDGDKSIDKNFTGEVPTTARPIVQAKLAALISAAMTTCSGEERVKPRPTKTAIDKTLNQVIYAAEQGRGVFGKTVGSGDAGQVANSATDGALNNKHPLAYAIMCVSMAANTQNTLKLTNDKDNAQEWEAGNDAGKTAYDKVQSICGAKGATEATAAKLRAAVQALRDQINMVSNVGYLGQKLDGSCTGSTATAGVCVKYANTITNHKDEFNKLTYASLALEEADDLDRRTAAEIQDSLKRTDLDDTIKAAYRLTHEAEALHKALTSAAALPKSNPESAAKAAKAAVDCSSTTKKTACQAKAECTWESTEKSEGDHCKLNETYVAQKATQTGGSGTAATGCEKHGTDKEKCENDKKDGKPSRAWRKGKDGEDDKETEKCRNGSFLVNKQFALVVTAFVALLF
uniref:Variant surface glycoprotein 1125.2023 n=1 Tax=Trypanosoma brucei TaxID=5691 RepID=A0A1J0R4X1_9TRYP|nr:variant surface glycoprotein 1125.2023 [Trypanosoma brucei]